MDQVANGSLTTDKAFKKFIRYLQNASHRGYYSVNQNNGYIIYEHKKDINMFLESKTSSVIKAPEGNVDPQRIHEVSIIGDKMDEDDFCIQFLIHQVNKTLFGKMDHDFFYHRYIKQYPREKMMREFYLSKHHYYQLDTTLKQIMCVGWGIDKNDEVKVLKKYTDEKMKYLLDFYKDDLIQ